MSTKQSFFSRGKLLLTGEYVVLDGAKALALPTKLGQDLVVEAIESHGLIWKSLDHERKSWFKTEFHYEGDNFSCSRSDAVAKRLLQIFEVIQSLDSGFKEKFQKTKVTTRLEFPNDWGLGSSSTLINNICDWAQVDAYKVLEKTFGGSGYDVACAQYDSAIIYQKNEDSRCVKEVNFKPSFSENLYFVHLNRKQNSRDSITHYRNAIKFQLEKVIEEISNLSTAMLTVETLNDFESILIMHEELISSVLKTPTIKAQLFKDYPRAIKSLGGWGGDFILVVGDDTASKYFENKGYSTIIPYKDMII